MLPARRDKETAKIVLVFLVFVYFSLFVHSHTPNTTFRHLPPKSARFIYATEEALFISAQLSTDAVSALRKTTTTKKKPRLEATYRPSTHVNMRRIHPG